MTEAVHLDDRGLNWQTAFCEPGGIFWQELDALNYTQPPYSRHYPELLSLRIDHPCAPVHAVLVNNTYGPGVKNFTNVGPQQASAKPKSAKQRARGQARAAASGPGGAA